MISYPRKFGKLSGKIIGAAIEVHKDIGPGFTENIYHNAMKIELKLRSLSFETEKDLRIYYKDDEMGNYRVDLIVESEIVVELKAVEAISKVHVSQVIAYLKASRLKLGLILNFSKERIEIRRVVLDYPIIKTGLKSNSAPSASPCC